MRWNLLPAVAAGVMIFPAVAAEPSVIETARVLDSQAVDMGDRIVTYQRIEAPELAPQPAATPKPPVIERTPTVEELAEQRLWDTKRYMALFLSCSVYGGEFTEVHLHHEGQEVVFHSTIDFNTLSQLTELVTDDAYYILILGVGDLAKEDFHGPLPHRLLNTDRAAWQVAAGDPAPELIQALGDLHRHYDANKDVLIAQRIEWEAEWAAREQWLKDNPPVPQDTTIRYFPIRSSRYGDAVTRQP